MHDLANKRVLVTGSTSGIGAAIADGFLRQGASVCLHGSSASRAPRRTDAGPRTAHFIPADLSRRGAAQELVVAAADLLGGLDVLVNNAGANPARARLDESDDDLFDAVIDLNLRSVAAAMRAAHPYLKAAGGGAIINTGSASGRNGGPGGSGLYAAAKAGVQSLTRTAAKEFGPDNIRVNAVLPGIIETPFHAGLTADARASLSRATPLGRIGTPEDCVGVYLFLASASMSGFITGQSIDVNGGFLIP